MVAQRLRAFSSPICTFLFTYYTYVAQLLRASSLSIIPTLYFYLYAFALLSAYYLLVRLCITLRLLSNVTICTAQ